MSYKFEEGKDLIIEAVVGRLQQKMSGGQAPFCAEFVRQFYSTVALEDLREWDIDDLYGVVINSWYLIQHLADRKSVVSGRTESVRVNLGGGGIMKQKKE